MTGINAWSEVEAEVARLKAERDALRAACEAAAWAIAEYGVGDWRGDVQATIKAALALGGAK